MPFETEQRAVPSGRLCCFIGICTSKIKPKLVTKSVDGTVQIVSDVSRFRFISLNPSVAKVSKKGTVTGTSNGTCTVYVIAENGMVKHIKVTVK